MPKENDKRKYFIWAGLVVVFLLLVMIFFFPFSLEEETPEEEVVELDPVSPPKEESIFNDIEERKREKEFYEETPFKYWGWSEEEIRNKYGYPDKEGEYMGIIVGRELYYEDSSISFIFPKEEGFVSIVNLHEGAEIMETKVGKAFEEIVKEMRNSGIEDKMEVFEENKMIFLGEEVRGIGEIEMWFHTENSVVEKIEIHMGRGL